MARDELHTTVERMARECVGNQLRLLSRVVTGIYERELRPLKLTASQMVILALTAKQGRVLSVELSKMLQMDASTVSRNVERMRARGWLEQVPGKDERSRPLRVTARGKKMLGDASTAWEKAQEQAVALVGDEGVALLRRMSKELVPAFPGD
jgi:DNA-binding MarR family transcriptional regulator